MKILFDRSKMKRQQHQAQQRAQQAQAQAQQPEEPRSALIRVPREPGSAAGPSAASEGLDTGDGTSSSSAGIWKK